MEPQNAAPKHGREKDSQLRHLMQLPPECEQLLEELDRALERVIPEDVFRAVVCPAVRLLTEATEYEEVLVQTTEDI